MRDFRELQTKLQELFKEDDLVNAVYTSTADINGKHTEYWAVVVEATGRTDYEEYSNYTYNWYFINKQNPKTADVDIDWNYSMGMLIAKKAMERLEAEDISVQYPVSYSFGSVKFADVCDVVTCTVTLQIENEIDCR